MSLLPIYLFGTEALRKKAKPVKEIDNSVVKLVLDLFETMHKANGIGLAATQVGALQRVVVLDISDVEEKPDAHEPEEPRKKTSPGLPQTLTLINPELTDPQGTWKMEEGCLSIPDVRAQVARAETVRVQFRDVNDKVQEFVADGLLARVILHEVDHLNGVLFLDYLSPAKRAQFKSKLKNIKRGEVETSYPVISKQEE